MNLEIIEKRFCSYLGKFWKLSDVVPFLLVYIRLLVLFKSELSQQELNVTLERRNQLHGKKFSNEGFDQLKISSRRKMDEDIASNSITTRKAMLNRLLYCALLDAEENDFFYLTEPMFVDFHAKLTGVLEILCHFGNLVKTRNDILWNPLILMQR